MDNSPDLVERATAPDEDTDSRRRTPLLSPRATLALAGALCVVVQLILFDEGRFFEWDEAVYASRASDRYAPVTWSAHRALGVPWILSPILWLTDSMVGIRLWLIATSTVSLTLAFSAWIRVAGYGATAGFVLLCSNWMIWFYGSEASPNLYIAACAIGLIGLIMSARLRSAVARPSQAGIVLAAAAAVLLRPSDGVVLALSACGLAVFVLARREAVVVLLCSVSGIAVGAAAWILEASTFGGPLERWQQASRVVDSGLRLQLGQHLRLLDGPLVGPDRGAAGLAVVAVQLLPACVAVLALIRGRSVIIAGTMIVATALAAPYLLYVGALAPRFLLPTFGLIAAAAGVGAMEIASSGNRILTVSIAGLLALGMAVAVAHADEIEEAQAESRRPYASIGHQLGDLVGDQSCFVLSQYGYPQFSVASGCRGQRLDASTASCAVARAAEDRVFVAWVTNIPPDLERAALDAPVEYPSGWQVIELEINEVRCG